MKNLASQISAIGFLLVMNGLASAAVVSVNNWDGHQTGTYASVWTISAAADGNDVVYSWSRTGNLDGLGTNDTLSFDLRHEAFTGSSFSSPNVTLGSSFDLGGATNQHFGPNGDLDNNQSFRLSIENITFTQGEGLGWEATFNGFSDMAKFISEAEDVYIGTTDAEIVSAAGVPLSSPLQVLTVSMIGSDNANRFRDFDFAFTTAEAAAVPEPSSFAALIGGIGLLAFRRRRKGANGGTHDPISRVM